jgi:YHS domain-containing protein
MKKLLFLFLLSSSLLAQTNRQKHFLLEKGLAISGYDPVSYFSGKPAKGKPALKYTYEEISYLFSTAANLETFKKNPEKYEPNCGGWCSYAMGQKAKKVSIDPENFKIVDGRLNLFYKDFFSNTLDDWNENENVLKKKAQVNWQKIISN